MRKEQKKLLEKLIKLRNRFYQNGETNRSVAEQILGINQRTLSSICSGDRVPSEKQLTLYINTLEKYVK